MEKLHYRGCSAVPRIGQGPTPAEGHPEGCRKRFIRNTEGSLKLVLHLIVTSRTSQTAQAAQTDRVRSSGSSQLKVIPYINI